MPYVLLNKQADKKQTRKTDKHLKHGKKSVVKDCSFADKELNEVLSRINALQSEYEQIIQNNKIVPEYESVLKTIILSMRRIDKEELKTAK